MRRGLRERLEERNPGYSDVWGNVEVANIKVRREVSQLPVRARPNIR